MKNTEQSVSLDEKIVPYYERATALIDEVEKVVVGKRNEITMLICALISGGHVLIEDVPGVGKTTLAAALSKACGLDFKRAQFTPDVMASDITGFNIYNRQKETFEFREGLVMCNIMLADEINRASPKTQSSLLEAMEENSVTVDGVTYKIPDPFMVIATQNPSGYVGTYPLPEAQLDRFAMRLSMGYPSQAEEIRIITDRKSSNPQDAVTPVADVETIRRLRRISAEIEVSAECARYIVELVAATRKSEEISLGASPRASLALMRLSQAYAFMHKRDYVVPEDAAAMFAPCIAHRLVLSQKARLGRGSVHEILSGVMRTVEVPYTKDKTVR